MGVVFSWAEGIPSRNALSVTAAVLQGTRVSSSDESESRSGAETRTGTVTERERETVMDSIRRMCRTETDNFRWTCQTERRTESNGHVEHRDGKLQTVVSNREADSVRRTCRTRTDNVRWTCGTGTGGSGRARRYGDTEETVETEEREETEETEETDMRLIFRIEYKRLHKEKKKTKHGRQPCLYTQFSQLPYVLLLIPAQLTYVLILTFVFITVQLIQPSLMQPGPRTDTLSKIEYPGAR